MNPEKNRRDMEQTVRNLREKIRTLQDVIDNPRNRWHSPRGVEFARQEIAKLIPRLERAELWLSVPTPLEGAHQPEQSHPDAQPAPKIGPPAQARAREDRDLEQGGVARGREQVAELAKRLSQQSQLSDDGFTTWTALQQASLRLNADELALHRPVEQHGRPDDPGAPDDGHPAGPVPVDPLRTPGPSGGAAADPHEPEGAPEAPAAAEHEPEGAPEAPTADPGSPSARPDPGPARPTTASVDGSPGAGIRLRRGGPASDALPRPGDGPTGATAASRRQRPAAAPSAGETAGRRPTRRRPGGDGP